MKAKLLILLVLTLISGLIYSQISKGLFTSEQEFIYKAVDSALFIIRQDYVLRDTSSKNPTEYGYLDKEYYGRIYTFGVLADNKLWCDSKVRTPWLYDTNYHLLGKVDSIRPVLSKIAIRSIIKEQFQEFIPDRKTPPSIKDSTFDQLCITTITTKDLAKGVPLSHETQDSTGWIVIAYTDQDILENDSAEIKLMIYRPKPGFKQGKQVVEIKAPPVDKNILGGFYLTVRYTVGKIELIFSGVLHQENNTWMLSSIPEESAHKKEKSNLTPIKKTENSKKSNSSK